MQPEIIMVRFIRQENGLGILTCAVQIIISENPFESEVEGSYYSVLYADGETNEWCVTEDETGRITSVKVGGRDSWYMMGHTFWAEPFSKRFLKS